MQSTPDASPGQRWATDANGALANFRVLFDNAKIVEKPANEKASERYRNCRLRFLNSMLLYMVEIVKIGVEYELNGIGAEAAPSLLKDFGIFQQRVTEETDLLGPNDVDVPEKEKLRGQSILVLWLEMMLAAKRGSLNISKALETLKTVKGKVKRLGTSNQGCYFPGLPACILVNIGDSTVISASHDLYKFAPLARRSLDRRGNYLRELEALCLEEGKREIEHLRRFSRFLLYKHQRTNASANPVEEVSWDQERMLRFDLSPKGTLATWNTRGEKMKSCLLDHCRFKTSKDITNDEPTQNVYSPESCAEWCAFVEEVFLNENIAKRMHRPETRLLGKLLQGIHLTDLERWDAEIQQAHR